MPAPWPAHPGHEVRAAVLGGGYTVELPSGPQVLTAEDVRVEVEPRAGFQAAGSASAVVVLHAELTDDLREEGLSRELINRIQSQRKELGLGYTDRIAVSLSAAGPLAAAAERFRDHISAETLATSLDVTALEGEDGTPDGDIDGHAFSLRAVRATT